MRRYLPILLLALCALPAGATVVRAGDQEQPERRVREIFVPFKDLNVLLQDQPRRVMLSREEYDELVKKARKAPETNAPKPVVLLSADYTMSIKDQRAQLTGKLVVDVLEAGLHAVPLDLGGVGLHRATLDGEDAAIGPRTDGVPKLFVEGTGRHELLLEMVAPVETTAARQVLHFRLPRPPAARMELTVPGDVEVKSGAEVVSRVVDQQAEVTRFELLPQEGDATLMLSLNSRLQRRDQVVVAVGVLVDEVTSAYEKLHAAISMDVLHQAVDRFRFAVPVGFEIAEVSSPVLARWDVEEDNGQTILNVYLREPTTETVKLNLSAIKTGEPEEAWQWPKLQPLDIEGQLEVVGQVAVVGLLVDQRLTAEAIAPEGLVAIDTQRLRRALPETIFHAEPGTPPVRPVAAYYAPQGDFDLSARFVTPEARLIVTTNVLLEIGEKDLQVHGGFALLPEQEKRFSFDFTAPAGWHVLGVTTLDGTPLRFERYGPADQAARIHVRLPSGIPAGEQYHVKFHAVRTPPGWLDAWDDARQVALPVFSVDGAAREEGAIAVVVDDEMTVRPDELGQLIPLDERDKETYRLHEVVTDLAYRYETPEENATLLVERKRPRMTARTFSLFNVEPDTLRAHYEIVYDVAEARARQLSFLLPESTPAAVTIEGLDDLRLKENRSEIVDGRRRWTVLLEDARPVELAKDLREPLRLSVDFTQKVPFEQKKGYVLPLVRAEGVEYQSGLVAVEGHAELDVVINATGARRVDVGELVDAERQPGLRLLGVYGFVGEQAAVKVTAQRHPGYRLPPTIVRHAALDTFLSPNGTSHSQAQFTLRTKALFLEVELPVGSELWAAELDDQPIKPQREDSKLLVSLPAKAAGIDRNLKLVYSTPVAKVVLSGKVDLAAPGLWWRADREADAVAVPLADLLWRLHLPSGYDAVQADGTVVTDDIRPPEPAAILLGKACLAATGGVNPFYFTAIQAARESARRSKQAMYDLRHAEVLYDESGSTESGSTSAGAESGEGYFEYIEGEVEAPTADMAPEAAMPPATTAEPANSLPATDEPFAMPVPVPPEEPADEGDMAEPFDMPQEQTTTEALPDVHATAQPQNGEEPGGDADRAAKPAPEKPAPRRPRPEGMRSLKINLSEDSARADRIPGGAAGRVLTFRSLGADPRVEVRLADRTRFDALALALILAVVLRGLAITRRPVRSKVGFVLLVALVATFVPLLFDNVEATRIGNAVFWAACLLVPYYLLVGMVRWIWRWLRRITYTRRVAATSALAGSAAALLMMAMVPTAQAGSPQADSPKPSGSKPYVIQVVEPLPPVKVPEDAIVLPYDPKSKTGIEDANQLLVPYAEYVELWNRAYPDKKIEAPKVPAPYATAGGSYSATLEGDEYLLLSGQLKIDVYADGYVTVPMGLQGGVLALAELDGKPARLSVVRVDPANNNAPNAPPQSAQQQVTVQMPNQSDQPAPPDGSLLVLHVSGKGRHTLELAVRMRLSRQGGWRVAEGRLPAAPATALNLTVPLAETEVRLGEVVDRQSYETDQPNQKIATALSDRGGVRIQWRPKVAEGQVDRSLTARSTARLDVQEDGLRMVWRVALEFARSQRNEFRVDVPTGYLVETVEGSNVRGWQEDKAAGTVDVTLLKEAKDHESFTLHLLRTAPIGQAEAPDEFDVPVVGVPDAALHSGEVLIRRSPLLELWTVDRTGVTRTDLDIEAARLDGGSGTGQSPLGIQPFQAYQFVTTPFSLRLAARSITSKVTATTETALMIGQYERTLESRVVLRVQGRAIHRAEMLLPEELDLQSAVVVGPDEYEWNVTPAGNRQLLTVLLAAGRTGDVSLVLSGTLGQPGTIEQLDLPQLEVVGVERQQGEIAVQVDPAYDVVAKGLGPKCDEVPRSQLYSWITRQDRRDATRLALRDTQPDYQVALRLTLRKPQVSCTTISNVKVTDRTIEETIVLDYAIRNAGVDELSFRLPARMKDARFRVNLLRQKTITPVAAAPDDWVDVRLQLQDEVMGDLRVVVENDRLLKSATHAVPIPVVQTGQVEGQFVALENAGQDEVVVEPLVQLQALRRQQKQWDILQGILGDGIMQAYVVVEGAQSPRLAFTTKAREAVETVEARIGLAETTLVFDPNGAYRAKVVFNIDNRTEQVLDLLLPAGASLWTAQVSGSPVKPAKVPETEEAADRKVRIPLVKTAAGALDQTIVVQYGGKLPGLGNIGRVDFPLLQTVNIDVDQSIVRLHLPESYNWLDFGGTMGQPRDAAELEAERQAYQAKVGERLLQTMRYGSKFDQVRAASNVKNWRFEVEHGQRQAEQLHADNQRLQTEWANNASILLEAEKEAQKVVESPEVADYGDNRDRLNVYFEDQKTVRATNAVKDLGGNWSGLVSAGQQAGGQQQPAAQPGMQQDGSGEGSSQSFDQWLDYNGLLNPVDAGQPGRPEGQGQGQGRGEGKPTGAPNVKWKGAKKAPPNQYQPQAAEIIQGQTKAQLGGRLTSPTSSREPRPRGKEDVFARYQKQLEERQVQRGAVLSFSSDGQQIITGSRDETIVTNGAVAVQSGDQMTVTGGGVAVEGLTADLTAVNRGTGEVGVIGAHSLLSDVYGSALGLTSHTPLELPTRGKVYEFTTAGGDVQITARAVSDRLTTNLGYLGIVLAIGLVVAIIYRLIVTGRLDWFAGRAGTTTLICLGLVMLIGGIFPGIGLVALVAGIVLKIRLFIRKRRARKAKSAIVAEAVPASG